MPRRSIAAIALVVVLLFADHTWRLGEQLVTFYRCIPHGGPEDGLLRCVALVDGRFLTPAEARKIPIGAGLCKEQG